MSGLRVSLIAAVAKNGVIGDGTGMPWRLSTDMQRFKRLTMGRPVVVGRKTFEGFGRALQGRTNIVVSRHPQMWPQGVIAARDLPAALEIAKTEAERSGGDEVMILGGGEIYAETIGLADRLYVTHVDAAPAGRTRFPPIDPEVWRAVSREAVPPGPKDSAATTFVVYERAGR
ncbi:dihydrofolate reductase [soil metagenome]